VGKWRPEKQDPKSGDTWKKRRKREYSQSRIPAWKSKSEEYKYVIGVPKSVGVCLGTIYPSELRGTVGRNHRKKR